MKDDSWEIIKNHFHESLERPSNERERYLARVCGSNVKMLEEVRGLLAAYERDESFLESKAIGEVADLLVTEPEESDHGRRFGRYQIMSLLGEGGMGRVFLAKDTELERFAAVKILSPLLSKDKDRLRRFVREAKAASSLNHPNILTIYEIGHIEDSHFIATEYVEGETLRERQNRKPLNLREILDLAVQLVSALDAAHRARIIHRDIKPDNIMLRRDGIVKILDFGLAKLLADDAENVSPTAKTQSALNTAPGIVLGTTAYMSPEQARGLPVDARTDIWSCGVCLYELITGVQPFGGETMSDIIAEILTREPPPPSAEIPVAFVRLVEKTLQKDPAQRHQTAESLLADLKVLHDSLKETDQTALQTVYKRIEPTARNKKAARLSKFTTVFSGIKSYSFSLIIGIILCAMLALAGAYFYQKNRSPAVAPEAARWFASGTEAARSGNYYKARKMLEQAIQADDRFLQAYAKLAEIQMELDYEDKAAQSMLRVTELMPQYSLNGAETDYLRAVLATVRRDNRSAVAAYEEIVAEAPETEKTFALFDLGRSLEKIEASERAIEIYEETVRRDPQFAAAYLRLGTLYWYQKEEAKALGAFDQAAAIYTANSDYDGVGDLFYQKGALYNFSDNLAEAEKNLNKSLEIAQATANLPLRIKTTLSLGEIGYNNGDTTHAEKLINEALQLSRAENLENLTIDGLTDFGTLLYFQGEYDKAAQFLEQALQTARTNGAKRAEARALLSLGNLALLRRRPAEAVRYIEPALNYYSANDFRQEQSQAQLALGCAYDQTGRYASAIELLEKVLEKAKEEDDQAMIAHTESALGLALIHTERFAKAIERCENSLQISRTLGREQIAAYALLNKAQAEINLGSFREAREALAQTLGTAKKIQDKQLVSWVHLLRAKAALFENQNSAVLAESTKALQSSGGQVEEIIVSAHAAAALAELSRGDLAKAAEHYRSAEEAAKKIENTRLLPHLKLVQSEIFLKEKNTGGALQKALQVRAVFSEQGAKYSEWRALAVAAEAARLTGDLSSAKEYARQAQSISASLEKDWGAENFQNFQSRKDTAFYQSLIEKVLSEK